MSDEYRKLELDFEIPEDLAYHINEYVNHMNYGNGLSRDICEVEIAMCLRDYRGDELTEKQYKLLKDYYLRGGMYGGEKPLYGRGYDRAKIGQKTI